MRNSPSGAVSAVESYKAGEINLFRFVASAGLITVIFFFISKAFASGISGLFRLMRRYRWTSLVVLVALVATRFASLWVGLIVILVPVALVFLDKRFSPIYWDIERNRDFAEAQAEVFAGNDLIVRMGVAPEDEIFNVRLEDSPEKAVLWVDEQLPRHSASALLDKAKEYKYLLNAESVTLKDRGNGRLSLIFLRENPLDEPFLMEEVPSFDPSSMSVDCARDQDGNILSISFREVAGMVVGGIPGSGKTAGTTSFLFPLALSDDVDLSIIDGKGGSDWESYIPRTSTYIRGDEDLEPIRDFLASFYEDMNTRLASLKELLGTANFWNAPVETRRAHNVPFKLLVIDECQGLFERRTSKEDKELQTDILRFLSQIVKRGRSAGICVILITQKPTAEALPTAVRDNASLRIAFRLMVPEAERAVLGTVPEGLDLPRATAIPPSRKGGAVFAKDTGEMAFVRFAYIPEALQEELLQ